MKPTTAMRKLTVSAALAALALLIVLPVLCAGCRKGGINGDLDGQWRIINIEKLPGNVATHPENRFINLYLHTVNLTVGGVAAAGNMTYSGDRLTLEFPYHKDNEAFLNPWGIYSWQTTFTIRSLSSRNLVLSSDSAVITLKKF